MDIEEIKYKIFAYLTEEFCILEEQNKDNKETSQNFSEKFLKLKELEERCKKCTKCTLYKDALNLVFSDGDYNASLVFVGEAPGEEEDKQGKPFVGRAGKLLTMVLEEFGMPRERVYICNVLKHRPPGNRNPLPEEIAVCTPYLIEQLSILKPKLVVTLGNFSTKFLLNSNEGVSRLRGVVRKSPLGYNVLPTYHPAAVLRNMNHIEEFKNDIKKALNYIKSGESIE
jgi:DNA polymerase